MASSGLSPSGRMNARPRRANWTCPLVARSPAPRRAPSRLWVVEIGRPTRLAMSTVAPAPTPAARTNRGSRVRASGTRPFPKHRRHRPRKRRNRRPGDRPAVGGSPTPVESRNPLEIVVRAVREGDEHYSKNERYLKHGLGAFAVSIVIGLPRPALVIFAGRR